MTALKTPNGCTVVFAEDGRRLYTVSPPGTVALASRGDFILCHRRGLVSALVRMGERLRFRSGARWSHAAYCFSPHRIVEALADGVHTDLLAVYYGVEYVVVHTHMDDRDALQAWCYACSRLGERYGWAQILGIAMRFLTPGRGVFFGLNGTDICSGLVAQALERAGEVFAVNAATITPAELAEHFGVPDRPTGA